MALANERRLYIEAAARQLDALLLYERNGGRANTSRSAAKITSSQIDENYAVVLNEQELGSSAERAAGHAVQDVRDIGSVQPQLYAMDSASPLTVQGSAYSENHNVSHNPLQSYMFHPSRAPLSPANSRTVPASNLCHSNVFSALSSDSMPANRLTPDFASPETAIASSLYSTGQSLSTELRNVLNQSTFDPGLSIADMSLGQSVMMSHIQCSTTRDRRLRDSTAEEQVSLSRNPVSVSESSGISKNQDTCTQMFLCLSFIPSPVLVS